MYRNTSNHGHLVYRGFGQVYPLVLPLHGTAGVLTRFLRSYNCQSIDVWISNNLGFIYVMACM